MKHNLFQGMIAKTLSGNHVQNVMIYNGLDAKKFIKKEYLLIQKLVKPFDINI